MPDAERVSIKCKRRVNIRCKSTACETINDLDQLYGDLGMDDETPDDVMHSVCDPELPDAGETWGGVVERSGEWLENLLEAV